MRVFVVLLAGLLAMTGTAFAAARRCGELHGTGGLVVPLPEMHAQLRPGASLQVLAVGSARVFESEPVGDAAATSAGIYAFPRQMARALEAAIPGLTVTVTLRGRRGMAASDMVPLIRAEMAAHRYGLVLWQTGTVEAVQNISPDDFAATLLDGVDAVRGVGADIVLIDPAFSRFLEVNTDLGRYEEALQQAAFTPGVALFHRFDLMRGWASDGQIDLERMGGSERTQAIERIQVCIGERLARLVMAGAKL